MLLRGPAHLETYIPFKQLNKQLLIKAISRIFPAATFKVQDIHFVMIHFEGHVQIRELFSCKI